MSNPYYLAVIENDEDSAFGVWFPDLPGCYSAGDTLQVAMVNARDALRIHVESLDDLGKSIPAPRDIDAPVDDISDALDSGATLTLVPLLIDAGRSKRLQISMDAGLVAAIDADAKARGITRSAYLADAARTKLAG